MKKKMCILALAGSVVALTIAIMHAKRKNKSNQESGVTYSNDTEVKDNSDAVQDLECQRKQVSNTISERHWKAAKIVREAMTDMEEYKEENSKYKKDFDEIDNNINILLDEEQ